MREVDDAVCDETVCARDALQFETAGSFENLSLAEHASLLELVTFGFGRRCQLS